MLAEQLYSFLPPSVAPLLPLQVSRALAIKSQYLTKTALELESKRQQAVQEVGSGILGLGLLREENERKSS